eukprot:722915-Rhodomonas_salina.1
MRIGKPRSTGLSHGGAMTQNSTGKVHAKFRLAGQLVSTQELEFILKGTWACCPPAEDQNSTRVSTPSPRASNHM